jgi:S1-C subfamily serine protease
VTRIRRIASSPLGSGALGGAVVAALCAIALAAGWIGDDDEGAPVAQASLGARGEAALDVHGLTVNEIYRRAAPGVAFIQAESTTPSASPLGPLPQGGGTATGSGFVIDEDGHIVTNAHVIAGATTVRIGLGEQVYDAVPVFVDPALDIALVHAPRLDAPALRFATSDPVRGAAGATLGFPGGRGLDVQPAAVTGAYSAQGRDIYGQSRVTRPILELRAMIDQGDSGGPLILEDGTVGGVVFAEARTDEDVGYALSPTSVAVRIQPAIGRTGAVPLGECIR